LVTDAESDVRDALESMVRAWADNDADAFVDWYADDATVVIPGYQMDGRAAIRAAMTDAFEGPLEGTTRSLALESVRLLAGEVAIVIGRSAIVAAAEAEPPSDRWTVATWVLAKRGERWLVEAYHDCPATSGAER
jgi:uncharacterized protein (TIGR02246 family)